MSRKLSAHRYEELKSLGADLIEDYGLVYPLDPFEIADALGVRVTIHRDGLPQLAERFVTSDGYTEPVASLTGWRYRIHVNGATPPLRQRFTLFHELAHVWLDHLRADTHLTDELAEGEANFLASYVLAPDVLMIMWAPGLVISRIAEVFQLSEDAAGLAHARVVRALNKKAIGRPHDQRIAASAARRQPAQVNERVVGLGSK